MARREAKAAGRPRYEGRACLKHPHNRERFTSNGWCVKCSAASSKTQYALNPGAYVRRVAEWRKTNGRKRESIDKERARRGLPAATRPEPKSCECCGGKIGKGRTTLCLDHDHTTQKFRGWICGKCNSGIALLGDTVVGVMNAVRYLRHAR